MSLADVIVSLAGVDQMFKAFGIILIPVADSPDCVVGHFSSQRIEHARDMAGTAEIEHAILAPFRSPIMRKAGVGTDLGVLPHQEPVFVDDPVARYDNVPWASP